MKRRRFLQGSAGLSVMSLLQHHVCAAQTPMGGDADADSVAIYSKLLDSAGAGLDPDEQFGVDPSLSAATAPMLRVEGESELQMQGKGANTGAEALAPTITSPADMAPTIKQMVMDLVKLGPTSRTIPRGVTIPKACLLMTPEDIREFRSLSRGATWSAEPVPPKTTEPVEVVSRFGHVQFLVSYSAVVFNADRSLAMVALSDGRGPSSSFEILGKSRSEWHLLQWDIESVQAVS